MLLKRRKLWRAADLFCGLGGFSQGAEESGYVRTVLAINHWRPAALSFGANHPQARVICARIDDVDPRNDRTLPDLELLLASPECTHHSVARGGQPVEDQKRATPFHVLAWTETKRPKWVVIENVREFRDWGPLIQKRDGHGRLMVDKKGRPWMTADPARKGQIFRRWLRLLESLGYAVDHQVLNAADYGAATTRQRLFIIAKREDVRAKEIPWPEPTHSRAQWRAAAEIIDWSISTPSIFDRKRPLAPKTLRRIEIGLRKFVGTARGYLVQLYGTSTVADVQSPLPTVTAQCRHTALATPFMVQYHGGVDPQRDGSERCYGVDRPLPTIDTNPRYAVATPFLTPNFSERPGQEPRTHSVDDPLPTVTGHGGGCLAVPFQFKAIGCSPGLTRPITAPVPTIVACRSNHSIVQPFLLPRQGYYDCHRDKPGRSIEQPLPVVTANHSPAHLVTPYLIDVNHGHDAKTGDRCNGVDVPLGTVTSVRGKGLCLPFLTKYYGTGTAADPAEPLDVITTKDRYGLAMVHLAPGELGNYLAARAAELGDDSPEMRSLLATMAELGVFDIGFRMLTNTELLLAQSFPAGYKLEGARTLAEETKLIGNAVPPVFGRAICRALAEAA
jgi:DNA (cytosine-5)-methyltransferase 1